MSASQIPNGFSLLVSSLPSPTLGNIRAERLEVTIEFKPSRHMLPRGTETFLGTGLRERCEPMAELVLELGPQDSSSAHLKTGLSRGSSAAGEEHALEV